MKTLTNKDKQVCSACGGTNCASFMSILKENKMSNNNLVVVKDNKSSIKVAQNAKGDYMFEVKTYYDETETNAQDVVKHNKEIIEDLHKEFK